MKDNGVREQLARIDLFEGLSKRQLNQVVESGREVAHDPGHEVMGEGHLALGFHLILEGEATVIAHGTPRRTLHAGDHFGEISLIDGKPRSASVIAEGPMRTFVINSSAFQPLLDEHPEIARGLLRVLCQRLRAAEDGAA